MIFKSDMLYNFLFVKLVTTIRFVYYDFNLKERRFELPSKAWQKIGFWIIHLTVLWRYPPALYAAYREYLHPSQKIHHTTAAYGFPAVAWTFVGIHIITNVNYGLYVNFMNETYDLLPEGKRTIRNFFKLELLEMMLIFCPTIVITSGPSSAFLAYLFDPENPMLMWAIVPTAYRNTWSWLGMLLVDVVCFSGLLTVIYNFLLFGIIFILFMDNKLKYLVRSTDIATTSNSSLLIRTRMLQNAAKEIKITCLRLRVYNETCSYVLFLAKVLCLAGSIIPLFIVIVCIHERNLVIAICNVGFAAPCTILYVVVLDRAFGFPDQMKVAKMNYILAAQRLVFATKIKYHKAQNKSFWFKGLKVGGFQVLERESTPNFLAFVVDQVASLLMGYYSL